MKQKILTEINSKLSALGIPVQNGNGADVTISTEFLGASWSTGKKQINYEASVFINEASQTVFMWEKTTETGRGLSFGGESGISFQSGKTLFRKVKSIQYAPDGKAYEYTLDLGAIPKNVKETAKQHGWKFKTVLSRNNASYPPGYMPSYIPPQTQANNTQPQTEGFCTNCGMPLEAGGNFCNKCGLPRALPHQESVPQQSVKQESVQRYSDPQGPFYAQSKPMAAAEENGKSSAFNTIVFWVAWSILTLLCLIMLADEFSVLRFVGFAALVVLPIIVRKRLFRKLLPSLFWWLIALIVFVLIIAVTGSSSNSSQVNANFTVQSQDNVTVSMLKGVLPEGSSLSIVPDKNPPIPEIADATFDADVTYEAYDITLPLGSVMDSVAEITLPFDKKLVPSGMSPEEVLTAAYFNPQTNAWEPVPYIINADQGVVTILTDHFSKYAVVYFKDGRKKLSTRVPEFDSNVVVWFFEGRGTDYHRSAGSSPGQYSRV